MPLDRRQFVIGSLTAALGATCTAPALAQKQKPRNAEPVLEFPPQLPGGKLMVSDTDETLLKPAASIREGVQIAKTPPTVDYLYYPGQDYPGKIWSNWGEGTVAGGKYYSAIGDHNAPAGTARVFEYDPAKKSLRQLLDLKWLLNLPEGDYSPSKIHSRTELAADGWVYCSTHRGSTTVTTDKYHYVGDWIVRCHPASGQQEVVVRAPVPKHCIPTGRIDPERMIFYGATSPGEGKEESGYFFAYDLRHRKLLYSGPNGPSRSMIVSRSTGKVYFTPGTAGIVDGPLMRFDPQQPSEPVNTGLTMGLRAATDESADGMVYAASHSRGEPGSMLYSFNVKTEQVRPLVPLAVGVNEYVGSLAVDPSGRFLYYIPGAHGGSERDGTAVVQFDTRTNRKKVIAFLEPFYTAKYGCTLKGTYV